MSKCPICGISVSRPHNLKVHLAGREPEGHGIKECEAEEIAGQVFAGNFRPAMLNTPKATDSYSPELVANPYSSFLIRLLESMVANKRLPKYQFERRIDSMVTLFLPGILRKVFGWRTQLVAPEFPLRKETNNQSTNVDHLLYRQADDAGTQAAWIFFELKTDAASCSDPQLEIYRTAMALGMPRLLSDLRLIADASGARAKYRTLTELISPFPEDAPIELVYLAPCRIKPGFDRAHALTFADLQEVTLPEYPEVWDLFCKIVLPSLLG